MKKKNGKIDNFIVKLLFVAKSIDPISLLLLTHSVLFSFVSILSCTILHSIMSISLRLCVVFRSILSHGTEKVARLYDTRRGYENLIKRLNCSGKVSRVSEKQRASLFNDPSVTGKQSIQFSSPGGLMGQIEDLPRWRVDWSVQNENVQLFSRTCCWRWQRCELEIGVNLVNLT